MPAKKPPEGYVTIPQAAAICGCSKITMNRIVTEYKKIPYKSEPAGARTFRYLKRADVEWYRDHTTFRKRGRPFAQSYEIIIINSGKVTVLFRTSSPRELSMKYSWMMEHGHRLIRIRADGTILTIHESDKLGYAFNPRSKKGAYA